MSRGRAYRRHQAKMAKLRAYRWLSDGWLSATNYNSSLSGMKNVKGFGRKWHPDYKVICLWASTSGVPCSCVMCGNPRRHFGNSKTGKTLQERKADQREPWAA